MSAADHALKSTLATAAITRSTRFRWATRIAIYLPFDAETNTASLVRAGRQRGVRLYVPVVTDLRRRKIGFYPLSPQICRGAFGIAVPRHRGRPVAARWLDLIVVPLVGIDRQGRRLGMGGGFYDRALRFRRDRRCWMGPRLIGLAFDCQQLDHIDVDPWDVRLDSLATESGLRHFPQG